MPLSSPTSARPSLETVLHFCPPPCPASGTVSAFCRQRLRRFSGFAGKPPSSHWLRNLSPTGIIADPASGSI